MRDRIRLTGLRFYAYHGVAAAERETGRQYEIDCELVVDLAQAGHSDDLTDTIDYSEVYEVIRETVTGHAFSLLEGLANQLAGILLDQFEIYSVTVRVRKLHPPINGPIDSLEVEVTRDQGDLSKLLNRDEV
mgnify:CR=1 FL=1